MANLEINASSEVIKIDGFSFVPAEAEALKAAISFAGGMRDFPGLPPKIEHGRFIVHFHEDGTLVVSRSDQPGEIHFSFDTVDKLVTAINSALATSTDLKKLRPSPRHAGSMSMFNHGDIIEGR
jgi:hypothetical protein